MPPKKNPETPEEQAKRFRREARKLAKDGDLDPVEAERVVDELVKRAGPERRA